MHELGLLAEVVRVVTDATGGRTVEKVALRVGARSGAVTEALLGAWPVVIAGTPLEGAELAVEEIGAAVWCSQCSAEREVDEYFDLRCPVCDAPTGQLVRGHEFEVAYADTRAEG